MSAKNTTNKVITNNNKKANLATINKVTKAVIINFANAMTEKAKLSNVKMEDMKKLREALNKAENEEQVKKAQADILAREEQYKKDVEPFEEDIKIALKLVSKDVYESYKEYVSKSNNNSFKKQVEFFLAECQIESGEVGYKWVTTMMLRKIGVKQSSSKNIEKTGNLTTTYSRNQFNKIFLSCFYDLLVEKSVIRK